MAEADILQRQLISTQNSDGGWGYQPGTSWTEPTALALLALEAHNKRGTEYNLGYAWLLRMQRPDGGWPPTSGVTTNTCVTSVATLALSDCPNRHLGIKWLTAQIKPEDSPFQRLLARTWGKFPELQPGGGSPWFPGTAPWVAPTAMSILAFSCAMRADDQQLRALVHDGQQYLLSRRCRDGGWNHGGSRYRSETANSYPEMTGLALLALSGIPSSELAIPLKRAETFLRSPGSVEALSWLQLAMYAHTRNIAAAETVLPCYTGRDTSLRLLALTASSATNKLSNPV